jgi:hypothetical protein
VLQPQLRRCCKLRSAIHHLPMALRRPTKGSALPPPRTSALPPPRTSAPTPTFPVVMQQDNAANFANNQEEDFQHDENKTVTNPDDEEVGECEAEDDDFSEIVSSVGRGRKRQVRAFCSDALALKLV